MVLNNNLGRPRIVTKHKTMFEYWTNYVKPIKDSLFGMMDIERKKEKEYNAAKNKRILQEQKLNTAYGGFEHFKK